MRIRVFIQTVHATGLATMLAWVGTAQAQTNNLFDPSNPTVPGDWNVDGNWDLGFRPEARFDEIGVIDGNLSAFVADTPPTPGGIVIIDGKLEIRSGGNLTAVPDLNALGNLTVGQGAGLGNVIVRRGGTLNVREMTTGGSTASEIVLGEIGGAGSATLSVTGGTLSRTMRIVGNSVNFSSSGNLTFASPGTLVPIIAGTTHSAINVSGTAILGGTVRPEFDGYSPALGDSWDLITAAQLSGQFSLDASNLSTPLGTGFQIRQSAGTATLKYTNTLVLTVNRVSGQTKIENLVGDPITFEGYTITSSTGLLSGDWNSLADQNVSAWDEADNSNNLRLTEFNPTGTSTLHVGNALSLDSPYAAPTPTALGQALGQDLSFEYAIPGQGVFEGVVRYVGQRNNVVLTIDPTTGAAAIQNESPYFAAQLEGYTITSTSGLLKDANGQWLSLQDQNLGDWDEADNSDNFRLTEFNPLGTTTLTGGGTVLNLGNPVDVSGGAPNVADFGFSVALSSGQVLQGIVVLGNLPTSESSGDFDSDDDVDGRDFLIWQRGGSPNPLSNSDLAAWQNSYGTQAPVVTSHAIPEPGAVLLVTVAVLIAATRREHQSLPFA